MVVIVFESRRGAPLLEVSVPSGTRLVDVCDEHRSPIEFSCRSASCGTCRIRILEGGDVLAPPEDDELDLLTLMGDDPRRFRLACQARIAQDEGRVRVLGTLELDA